MTFEGCMIRNACALLEGPGCHDLGNEHNLFGAWQVEVRVEG